MTNKIEFTRVNNDTNGNPRYVVHFLDFLKAEDKDLNFEESYNLAYKRAKEIGGKKYRGKDYGGGFVFQSYNTQDLEKSILEITGQ